MTGGEFLPGTPQNAEQKAEEAVNCRKEIDMGTVFTREWIRATAIRMIRTFAESALAYIGTGAILIGDVNWLAVLSAGAMGAAISFLMALAGLPEVKQEEEDPWHGE